MEKHKISKNNKFVAIQQLSALMLSLLLILLSVGFPAQARSYQSGGGVITTNFPKPGDTSAAPVVRLLTLPTYGDYSNMETDSVSVTVAERDAALANMQAKLPKGISVKTLNRWQDAQEGLSDLQIVNNMPMQGALYTIVLPAHWSRKNKVPVLLSGNGAGQTNNGRLWTDNADYSLVQLVGLASDQGHTGLIAAYSNAGGTESMGVDDHTYKSVGAFFDFIAQNGGDPQQAIMAGASRGGGTSLMWAINPLKLAYNTPAVFADIPPTAYGFLSQRSVLTYPDLGLIYEATSHDLNAYRYDSPHGPGKPHPDYLTALFGVGDPTAIDARSPIGMAGGLKGKIVVMGRGTHDSFFTLRDFVTFDHRLTDLDIVHTTIITLGQGHHETNFLYEQLTAYVRALTQGKSYQPPAGRFIFINTAPPDGPQVPLEGFLKGDPNATPTPQTEIPFTAEFAAKAGVGLPVDLSMCGAPNSTYTYEATDASGKQWAKGQGAFDASECVGVALKGPDTPGEYAWTFTYNGKIIPSNYTPLRNEGGCGLPATTIVTRDQPTPDAPSLSEQRLGFGIDQYSAQDQGCIAKN